MMKNLYVIFLLLISYKSLCQSTFLISTGGTVSVNNGDLFYDAGGAAGNDGNTNYCITLKPAVSGQSLCLDFSLFNTYYDVSSLSWGYGDSVCIFDGASTSVNKIATLTGNYGTKWNNGTTPTPVGIGTANGLTAVTSPGIFCATNASGDLTVCFYNVDPTQSPGWAATILSYIPLGAPGCSINLTANPTSICPGQTVTLNASGTIVAAGINNNFNASTVGTGWQGTSSATFSSNDCGKPSLDGSVYLWMSNASCPRTLTSNGIDVSKGGTVYFEYRQADGNGDPSPCEAPDINMNGSTPEAVFLQYSTNAGSTWNTMKVMFPSDVNCPSGTCDDYPGIGYETKIWNKIIVPIPVAAQTSNTQFRWIMPLCSSASTDNWGLDNVIISSPKTSTITIRNVTQGGTVVASSTITPINVSVTPSVTTVYMATISDGIDSCQSTVTVTVGGPTLAISNTVNPACGTGGSFSITASGGSGSGYTYSINNGTTYGGTNTPNNLGAGSYTVLVKDGSGCTSLPQLVTLNSLASFSVNVNSPSICNGQTATITASGATSYIWSTGVSSISVNSATVSPITSTVYTVTGISGTCSVSTTFSVNLNSAPSISVNSYTICAGQIASIIASGATSYTWATGINSVALGTATASPSSTTTYTVSGSNGTCNGTTGFTITVNPIPIIAVNSPTLCAGQTATLTASGANSFTWSAGATAFTANTATTSPLVNSSYTVMGAIGSCTASAIAQVSIGSSVTLSVNSPTICIGQSATLIASGANSYTWSTGDNTYSITVNPISTSVYTVTGMSGSCSGTNTANVQVNSNPVLTVNSVTVCAGQPASLSASGALTYTWSSGLIPSGPNTATINPTTTATYTLNGSNGSCGSNLSFSITVLPLPFVNSIGTSICSGDSCVLTATGASNYTWTPSNGLSNGNSASTSASPLTTTQYTVFGADANGCINSDTATVTLITHPQINAINAQTCLGTAINLSVSGANSFTWTPTLNTVSSNGNSGTANPNSTTVYTITGSVGICKAVAQLTLTVNNLPAVNITSNSPVCANKELNLSASGGSNYFWQGPVAFSSSQQNPIITGISPTSGGTYSLQVIDNNGCKKDTSLLVIVNSLPTISAIGATVCVNSGFQLFAFGGNSYSWNGPSGFLSNTQNPVFTQASLSMGGTYVVTATDANNCINANVAQVIVNTLPTVIATSTIICKGDMATLSASGASNYTWFPLTGLVSNIGANVQAHPANSTTYTIIGVNSQSCKDTTLAIVQVIPTGSLQVKPDVTSGCEPLCLTFSGETSIVGTYLWNFGDGDISNDTLVNHCFRKAGIYAPVFTLTDMNGCKSYDTVKVTVYPIPHSNFTYTSGATVLDPLIQFQNLSTGTITTYQWQFGDSLQGVSSNINPSYAYVNPGTYSVQLIVSSNHDCKDSITQVVFMQDIFTLYVPSAFSPNGDGINEGFLARGEGIQHFSLYIFDRWGKQVFHTEELYNPWDGSYQGLGGEILQEDVYVWKIEATNFTGKIKTLNGTVTLLK